MCRPESFHVEDETSHRQRHKGTDGRGGSELTEGALRPGLPGPEPQGSKRTPQANAKRAAKAAPPRPLLCHRH